MQTVTVPAGWCAPAQVLWAQDRRLDAIQAAVRHLNDLPPPRPVAAQMQLAYYLFGVDDLASAAGVLERLVQQVPQHLEAQSNLAVCLHRLGRPEPALAHASAALALQPDHAPTLDVMVPVLQALGRLDEAVAAGVRALQVKDRAAGQPSPRERLPLVRTARPAATRNVIAFSLWGRQPRYLRGALRNALLAPALYPGWVVRFHVDASVPEPLQEALRELGCELQQEPAGQTLRQRLCWRFAVANDPTVDRFLVRDADAVFSLREARAVAAWCEDGRPFHVLRDWWTHTELMLAGLWGGTAGLLPDLRQRLADWQPSLAETRSVDQWFLREKVWPLIRADCLVHDRLFPALGARPLPGPMPDKNHHVGQDEHAVDPQRQAVWLGPWLQRLPCLQDGG